MARSTSAITPAPPGKTASLGHDLIAGLVVGVAVLTGCISFGALIFSGPLSPFLLTGIGISLFSAVVMGTLVPLLSSYPATIAYPQDRTAPILALMAASIAATLPPGTSGSETLVTVMTAIVVASLVTGLFLTLIGIYRFGRFIRFIPYPVMGGFLAGTGWLLTLGAMRVMSDGSVADQRLLNLFTVEQMTLWLPGLGFALLLMFLSRRLKSSLLTPLMIVLGIGAFYAVLWFTGSSVSQAREQGWLLNVVTASDVWHPLDLTALGQANLDVILEQASTIATIVLVSAISVLLNSSSLELAAERDINVNRELKAAGVANLVAGSGGGIVGFQSLSLSALALRLGAGGRVTGLVASLLCAVALFVNTELIAYFPKPVLGGLLMFLGLGFLYEWVFDAVRRLPRSDYVVVILILVAVGQLGYLQGVGVGIIAAIILFVINYSRVNVIKHQLSGASHQSNVDRPGQHRRLLHDNGERLQILKLQGYIFFGTANHVLSTVRSRIEHGGVTPLRFIVLDFRHVTGLDVSAVTSFVKLSQLCAARNVELLLTSVPAPIARSMEMGGLDTESLKVFSDLDHGTEWCEEQVIAQSMPASSLPPEGLAEQLQTVIESSDKARAFVERLDRHEIATGELLIRQGDDSDKLFFLESGRVTVHLALDDGRSVRLRTMGPGSIVGELGLYLGGKRTASALIEEDSVIYELTNEKLETLEQTAPDLAAVFHRYMAHLLAERLVSTNRTLQAVLD